MADPFGDDSFEAAPLDTRHRLGTESAAPPSAVCLAASYDDDHNTNNGDAAFAAGEHPHQAGGGGEGDGNAEIDSGAGDWDEEHGEYDRPAVGATMLMTGPSSRVAFDALRVAYANRGRTGLEAATNKFARGFVETMVAPVAASVGAAAAATSARFVMDHAQSTSPARSMPSASSAAAASSMNLDAFDPDGGPAAHQELLANLAPVLDAAGVREARLNIRGLPRNRFARIVMERAVREKGAVAARVLESLADASLAKHAIRLMHAVPAASLGARVSWGTDVDARARLLHNVCPRGGAHIVTASLDQLQVRLRAQKLRHAEGGCPGGSMPRNALAAFDVWFADIDAALSNAFATNPDRSGTIVLLTQLGDPDLSPTEMQRLFGRVHEAIVAREQQRYAAHRRRVVGGDSRHGDDDEEDNGGANYRDPSSPGTGGACPSGPPPVIALVALSVEYGSRSLRGAASGEVALADVKVICSAVNTHDGPLAASGLDLIRDVRGSFVGDHGIELVRDTDDLVQMLDAVALDAAIRDTGNPHCLVEGGLLGVDDSLLQSAGAGNGLATSLRQIELKIGQREPSVVAGDGGSSAALRRALRLLEAWGTILLAPIQAESPGNTPVCTSPQVFIAIAGTLIARFYALANDQRHEGLAVSSTLSASTFAMSDVTAWSAALLGRFAYAARRGDAAGSVLDMADDEAAAIASADDVNMLVALLQAHAVITTVSSSYSPSSHATQEPLQLFLPASTPAAVPAALPHLFAFLANRSSAAHDGPAVRWISTNVDPALVIAGLAAAFTDATRRGPAKHVLVWRDAVILGMDAEDNFGSGGSGSGSYATPQRTIIAAINDVHSGAPQRLLAVATVTPAFAANSCAAAGDDSIGAQMFGAVLEALDQLRVTHLRGLQATECIPCPACLRTCVPDADGAWVDGQPIMDSAVTAGGGRSSSQKQHFTSARRDTRTAGAASGTSVRADTDQIHVFSRGFLDAITDAAAQAGGRSDPTTQCPLCAQECRLRSLPSRAAKVLSGVQAGRDAAEPPSWAPAPCRGLLADIDALVQAPGDDPDAVAGVLRDFGPLLDSLAWTLVKMAAVERRNASLENNSWCETGAGADDDDESEARDEFGDKVARRAAATSSKPAVPPRQCTDDDWDVV